MITAASTSSRILGSVAASISLNLRPFAFSVISEGVASRPAEAESLIKPADCKRRSALPSLVGSLGIAIVAPFFRSAKLATFFE